MKSNVSPEPVAYLAYPFLTKADFPADTRIGAAEAGAAVTRIAEADIVRWVEFPPTGALFFTLVPGDPESGCLYLFDKAHGKVYSLDFDDKQFGGYSLEDYETLLSRHKLKTLARCPWLIRRCVQARKGG